MAFLSVILLVTVAVMPKVAASGYAKVRLLTVSSGNNSTGMNLRLSGSMTAYAWYLQLWWSLV